MEKKPQGKHLESGEIQSMETKVEKKQENSLSSLIPDTTAPKGKRVM